MNSFFQIGSSLLIAVFLVFSAHAGSCIALHETSSDSSAESHRDCLQDEFSARIPGCAQSQITHRQGHGSRFLDKQFNAVITSAVPRKCSGMREPFPAVARNRILSTVLRI
jgi:hypothetical protein